MPVNNKKNKKAKKILLVEDDPIQRMMYEIEFKNFGYNLFTAKNSAEAIDAITKHKPDLVFLDILLGEESGIDILRSIKSDKKIKNTKVVIMTNFNTSGLEKEVKKIGAIDFLIKSRLLPRQVIEKVKNYL